MDTVLTSAKQKVVIGGENRLTMIGERINPTGRKRIAKAVEEGDFRLIQDEAIKQVACGAQVLDVNVGVPGIDEPARLREAVLAIMEVTDVPLCLDSASPEALAAGLEVYQGKALVNSVNAESEKLAAVLPIVASHGAAVIGLTMGDKGVAKDANSRLRLAGVIMEAAQKHGIPPQDVVIDPLAMTISTDDKTGWETLEALRLIRQEFGVNQTLGLSNIAFGMPERTPTNALFLAMAVPAGLTCPIMDPTIWEMRRAALLADVLGGKDNFSMNYLLAYRTKKQHYPD